MKNLFISILFYMVAISSISQAAEISQPHSKSGRILNSSILIEGPIVKGDFKRFQYFVFAFPARTVWLASPGGDIAEAIMIGQLVRRLKMNVWAPERMLIKRGIQLVVISDHYNNLCASACFFIYAAGTSREGDVLGVHRPRITQEDLKTMTIDQAAFRQTNASDIASEYLRKMGIPNSIIEKESTTKPNDIQWLSDDEVKSLSGYIPEYEDWLEAKCAGIEYKMSEDPEPCKNCTVDQLIAHFQRRVLFAKTDCKADLASSAYTKSRQDLLTEYIENGRIQEVITEWQQVCANKKLKNQCVPFLDCLLSKNVLQCLLSTAPKKLPNVVESGSDAVRYPGP